MANLCYHRASVALLPFFRTSPTRFVLLILRCEAPSFCFRREKENAVMPSCPRLILYKALLFCGLLTALILPPVLSYPLRPPMPEVGAGRLTPFPARTATASPGLGGQVSTSIPVPTLAPLISEAVVPPQKSRPPSPGHPTSTTPASRLRPCVLWRQRMLKQPTAPRQQGRMMAWATRR